MSNFGFIRSLHLVYLFGVFQKMVSSQSELSLANITYLLRTTLMNVAGLIQVRPIKDELLLAKGGLGTTLIDVSYEMC